MKTLHFSTLGRAHDAPRFWVEGHRLAALGFAVGTPIAVTVGPQRLTLSPAAIGDVSVSYRRAGGVDRPVIDVNSARWLGHLADYSEIKVAGSFGRLDVTPTVRAFSILRGRTMRGPFRVIDVFDGAGTLSDALLGNVAFEVVAGVEIDPVFSDEWAAKHPGALQVVGDFRRMLPEELPECDGIVAGIPCTSHSNQGRAKKSLAGAPELGDTGDLFVPLLGLVAAKMPAFFLGENVPLFGTSLAGQLFCENLRRLGYDVSTHVMDPNGAWNEPTTRARWVVVATLRRGFSIVAPGIEHVAPISTYLDAPDATRDRADAERIAVTIAGLRVHNARHAAAGHGFAMQILDGSETSAPVICKSYHKINSSGFFIATPWGPRMLRKGEIERLHGQRITADHYATAVAMMGQGVLTRAFAKIFRQLGEFLAG